MLSYVISRKSNVNWLTKKNFIQEINWKSKSISSGMTRTWLLSFLGAVTSQPSWLFLLCSKGHHYQQLPWLSASIFNQQKG